MTDSDKTWDIGELLSLDLPPVRFLLDPYIPVEGIILLHGKFGTYKTTITTCMAAAIASGTELWGLQVQQVEPVLYVQLDTPMRLFAQRIQQMKLPDCKGKLKIRFGPKSSNILNPTGTEQDVRLWEFLKRDHKEYHYKCVFVDCLRCIHTMPDKDSETPHRVYGALQGIFPDTAIVVIHHDRKQRADDTEEMGDEAFAGSQAWGNHANVGVRIVHKDRDNYLIGVRHTKTHAGERATPLIVRVEGGLNPILHEEATKKSVREAYEFVDKHWPGLCTKERDKWAASILGVSDRTARRRRLEMEEPITP